MIQSPDIRIGNIVLYFGKQTTIDEDLLEIFLGARNYDDLEGVRITKEFLKEQAGFTIHDMGDFWQCEKGQFILYQPKFQILGKEAPFVCRFQLTIPRSKSFTEIHKLQNFYYETVGEEMLWNKGQSDQE